jgi:acetylornithine/succinyldiaminopimelate/putrescine aminotransferase
MWAYQHDGLEPDAVVVGKGLSGGIYPITATLMTRELHALFDAEPFIHISTFGGAEPGCAAGLAVLDVVEAPGFLEHVNQLAAFFRGGLSGLPFELRQRGLMMGLKFEAEGAGMMAAKLLFDAGLFTVYANNDTSVLQFLPPLVTTGEEAARMVEILRRAFA